MTKRRYYLPILAAVIGLVMAGCGGGSDDYTISVTVSGPTISASQRALGIATAIAPVLPGAVRQHSGKSRPRWNARRPAGSILR